MAGTSLHEDRSNKDKNYSQEALLPGTLKAFKPTTKHSTIIRIIPETDANGNPVPMIVGADEHGPLFSNIHREPIVFGMGLQTRFTGSCMPSDIPGMADTDQPFAGLYITLKGKANKSSLSPAEMGPVMQLLTKPANSGAPLSQVQKVGCVQAAVLVADDKQCSPPEVQAVFLSASAVSALDAVLKQAAQQGMDVFHPVTGCSIRIFGVPQGNRPPVFGMELVTSPMPLPEAVWRGKFLPWDKVIKRYTYDDLIRKMVGCFGPGMVAMRGSFAEAMQRLGIQAPPMAQPQGYQAPQQNWQQPAAQPQQAWAPQPAAQPQQGWGQPAQPVVAQQPWGQPPAQQPVQPAAQVQPQWAPTGAAPAAQPAANPWTPTAASVQPQQPAAQPATPPVTQATTAVDLAARYKEELAKLGTQPAVQNPAA